MLLNEFQKIAVKAYVKHMGNPLYDIHTEEEAERLGDALFVSIIVELSDAEDCDSFLEASKRILEAMAGLIAVGKALAQEGASQLVVRLDGK